MSTTDYSHSDLVCMTSKSGAGADQKMTLLPVRSKKQRPSESNSCKTFSSEVSCRRAVLLRRMVVYPSEKAGCASGVWRVAAGDGVSEQRCSHTARAKKALRVAKMVRLCLCHHR